MNVQFLLGILASVVLSCLHLETQQLNCKGGLLKNIDYRSKNNKGRNELKSVSAVELGIFFNICLFRVRNKL